MGQVYAVDRILESEARYMWVCGAFAKCAAIPRQSILYTIDHHFKIWHFQVCEIGTAVSFCSPGLGEGQRKVIYIFALHPLK